MKKLLTLLFCFISAFVYAQKPEQFIGSQNNKVVARGEFKVDSIFFLPNRTDTTFSPGSPGAIVRRSADKKFYYYDGDKWLTFTPPGEVGKYAVDSLEVLTDSTFRTRRNGLWTTYSMKGTGGTGLDTLYVNNKGATGIRISYATGDSLNISKLVNDDGSVTWSKNADSSANAKLNRTSGYLDIKNGGVASRTTSFKSYTDMRALATANLDTSYIYYFQNGGKLLPYRYSSTDVSSTDDTITTIVTGTGARLKLIYSSTLNATDFGAIPNDGVSDSYQIQKYINWAIANSQFPVINLQGGVYEAQNIRIMWDTNADGNWDFITLTLNGATPTFGTSTSLSQTTIFNVTDQAGFGIAVQAGRNVFINNISIKSGAPIPTTVKEMVEWTDAQWIGTYRNNTYSPHAGIVIDPFHSTVTGGNRYPNSTAYYTNSNAAASSMVTMNGVTIYGFVVGVMENSNGSSQNGDNIAMYNSHIEGCRSAWACGQSQSRANYVENLYITGFVKYVVNASEYGSGIGSAPTFTNLNVGGNGAKYLYKLTGGFSGITFNQGYCENIFSLGISSSYMPITFQNMQISLSDPTAANTFSSPILAEGGKLNFIGGSLRWFNNGKPAALNFNVDQLSFIGTHIDGAMPENRTVGTESKIQKTGFFDVLLQTYGARIGDNTNFTQNDLSIINRLYAITGNTYKPALSSGIDLEFKITGPKVDRILIESKTVDIDTVNNVLKITTPTNKTAYQINDFISIGQSVSSSITEYASAPGFLGFVSAITADTVFVQYFPYGLNESTTYDLYISRPAKLVMPTLGDITSGSNTVTNVLSNGGTFVAGDMIKGAGIPVGTRIASVGSGTFTLTRNATANLTKVELYDQLYDMTATGPDTTSFNNYIFFHNHKIINTNNNTATDTIQSWVCTTPGKVSGTSIQHPIFKLIKYNASLTGGGGSTTASKSTDSLFYNNGSNVYFARDSVKQGITTVKPVSYTSVTKRADAISVIKLPSSARMWMFYSQFGSSSGDNDTSEIRGKYSDDNGRTWSTYQIVVPVSGSGVYIPSAYFNNTNDTLYVIYLRANSTITNQLYQTYSTNFTSNTPTWSTGVSIYGSGSEYYSPASDRVLKLKNGEYLYPFCLNINGILFSSTGTYKGRLLRRASGNNAWSLVSGVDIVSPDSLCVEGGLFQTDDENSLVTYYWRTRSDQVYFAQSTTSSGLAYGSALPSGLYAPNSTTTIAYLEKFRTLVAVHNKWRGAAGTFTQREQLQLSVKHLGRDNGVNLFNTGVEGQWHSIYTIDSAANKHFIEPTIFPSDNELMVFYSQGDSYTGDTFEIKRASLPYYFLQGSDQSYQSSLMLNKTFDGVSSPNWLSVYANGLSRTTNFLSLSNQTNSINFFAPWWRLTTTRNSGDMLLHTIDAPGTTGSFFNIDGQTSSSSVANTQKIFGVTNSGVLKFGVFGDGRIGLGGFAGDVSSPSNGQLWYNSTTNKFRAYQNGAIVDVIATGGSGTDTSHIFTNGLTQTTAGTTATVKLGGTLNGNTAITQAGFKFTLDEQLLLGSSTALDPTYSFQIKRPSGTNYFVMSNEGNNTELNEFRVFKTRGAGNYALTASDVAFRINANTIANFEIIAGNDLAADNFRNFDLSFKSRLGSSTVHEVFRVRSYGAVEVAQWGGTGSAGPLLTLYQADRGIANAFIDFRNYATTGTGGFAPTLKTKSDGSGVQYGFMFDINANVNNAGDGFGMVYNIHNAGATITGTNPLYDIRNNATSVLRIRPDGEINIGGSISTDQGGYTVQNTGGLYQSGIVTLKGIATAPSTYNVAVHSTTSDSGLYVVPVASLTIEGTYTPTLTSVANITGSPSVTTCYYSVSGTTVTVWGEITFDPTTTLVATEVGISLPASYVSAIANSYELVGSATSDAINEAMNIKGDVTNDRARLLCTPVDVTNRTASFKFTYHYIAP